MTFQLIAPYAPAGDQPQAIRELVNGLQAKEKAQTLLGVTGSGKTFTMANVIATLNRPTLIISHNKTLAAQLYSEFKQFFPHNSVQYFVSYYDYYQPEAYLPGKDLYIEKDLAINNEIERLRLSTTSALLSGRRDVVVISSVSCIYGLANPVDFGQHVVHLARGAAIGREAFLNTLVNLLYSRNEEHFGRSNFRVRGDSVDVFLAYSEQAYRLFFFGNEVEAIHEIDPKTGQRLKEEEVLSIFPANLFVTSKESIERAIAGIEEELARQVAFFQVSGREQEAERLEERTKLDIDMMRELGYCSGIENYSRFFDGRQPGQRPYCLLDYFPQDYILMIDESHVTMPQIRGMWGGDHARKRHLVDYGFRIPSAMDNRPLNLEEFNSLIHQVVYISATPAAYELAASGGVVVEQIIRPTGLVDPRIEVRPTQYQIDDLVSVIRERTALGERTLVTTLTKHMAEELTKYLCRLNIKCTYLHSEVKTLERVEILGEFRAGVFDVLVGVNLLREGLDFPEVSCVAILDADKEGFLRSAQSLIQTIGRAARHLNGTVIMYADVITDSMRKAIEETERRRERQLAYNAEHGITPRPVHKAQNVLRKSTQYGYDIAEEQLAAEPEAPYRTREELQKLIQTKEQEMDRASAQQNYIKARKLQEELSRLRRESSSE